jgi:hypothetical protein
MINDDPELQARARNQGFSGISSAIHSYLPQREVNSRYERYMSGQDLCVVGDEKFKEGFDHPPMKTIIDSPHGSIVDKAQILGRGARKWWNESKQRYEGLTVIDTVIYIGSPDPEIDKSLREIALKEAVSIKQILDDTLVLSDAEPEIPSPYIPTFGGGPAPKNPFADDPNIEYYSSYDDVFALEAEVSRLRKDHYIEITDEMREKFHAEITRTGVGTTNILIIDTAPEDLTTDTLNILKSGLLKSMPKDHWEWLMATYASLEDCETRIEISEDMRLNLCHEIARTGVGATIALSKTDITDLKQSQINDWRKGRTKTAKARHWEEIMAVYSEMPDADQSITITEAMRQKLDGEMARTGIGAKKLLNTDRAPKEINYNNINAWKNGGSKIANKVAWDWVISEYEKLPDKRKLLSISSHMQSQLEQEIVRTGIAAKKLCRIDGKPDGLSPSNINSWRSGRATTTQTEYFNWVMSTYADLPDKDIRPDSDYDDSMRPQA